MALVQYGLNSGLVAISVALKLNQPVWFTWRTNFLWTSITYFAGASAAAIVAQLISQIGFYAFPRSDSHHRHHLPHLPHLPEKRGNLSCAGGTSQDFTWKS